jgi:hypothetical protein
MKNFKEFLSESKITITIDTDDIETPKNEEFGADVVWEGKLYRMDLSTVRDSLPTEKELSEQLQKEYPGAMVQKIYPVSEEKSDITVVNKKRFNPAMQSWVED